MKRDGPDADGLEDDAGAGGQGGPAKKQAVQQKRGGAAQSHIQAEQRRRDSIKEHLEELRDLVPACLRTDKVTCLQLVVAYVKELQAYSGLGAGESVPMRPMAKMPAVPMASYPSMLGASGGALGIAGTDQSHAWVTGGMPWGHLNEGQPSNTAAHAAAAQLAMYDQLKATGLPLGLHPAHAGQVAVHMPAGQVNGSTAPNLTAQAVAASLNSISAPLVFGSDSLQQQLQGMLQQQQQEQGMSSRKQQEPGRMAQLAGLGADALIGQRTQRLGQQLQQQQQRSNGSAQQ